MMADIADDIRKHLQMHQERAELATQEVIRLETIIAVMDAENSHLRQENANLRFSQSQLVMRHAKANQ